MTSWEDKHCHCECPPLPPFPHLLLLSTTLYGLGCLCADFVSPPSCCAPPAPHGLHSMRSSILGSVHSALQQHRCVITILSIKHQNTASCGTLQVKSYLYPTQNNDQLVVPLQYSLQGFLFFFFQYCIGNVDITEKCKFSSLWLSTKCSHANPLPRRFTKTRGSQPLLSAVPGGFIPRPWRIHAEW